MTFNPSLSIERIWEAGPKQESDAQASHRRWVWLAHATFFTCLCLQRFALPIGANPISFSIPVMLAAAGYMLFKGMARFSLPHVFLFCVFATWALVAAAGAVSDPDPRFGFSFLSVANILVVYVVLVLRPAGPPKGRVIQDVFLFYVRLCAVLGIAQFLLQFSGFRLFSFGQTFPALQPFLIENRFNLDPILSYGSEIRRSNGFFLVEPSVFSQTLAIAIVLDYLVLGRTKWLPLYSVAYMTSYSGSGLLALTLTMGFVGLSSPARLSRIVLIVLCGVLAAAVFSYAVPDQFESFASRFGFGDASGNARYFAQFEEVQPFAGEMRTFLGFGPGATYRSQFYVAGSGNPALQLYIDYGIIGGLLFYGFLAKVVWNRRMVAVSVILLVTFQLGGGYLLFAPFTLMMAAIAIWSEETTDDIDQGVIAAAPRLTLRSTRSEIA